MEKFSTLSDDLTRRILSKVSFGHRFVGGKLRRHGGIKRVTSYSFNEVVSLLNDEMPMIHFSALEKWVKEVIKDRELAEKITEAIANHSLKAIFDSKSSIINSIANFSFMASSPLEVKVTSRVLSSNVKYKFSRSWSLSDSIIFES